jgi:hypothetical protein
LHCWRTHLVYFTLDNVSTNVVFDVIIAFFGPVAFLMIGASRGFGRAIAKVVTRTLPISEWLVTPSTM